MFGGVFEDFAQLIVVPDRHDGTLRLIQDMVICTMIALRRPCNPNVAERRFEENDTGEIVFSVKNEARGDIGSRHGGRRIRQVIENLLRDQVTVFIDFKGVGVISSSFADEVFGRLFVSLGPRGFMRRVEIVNAAPTVEGLIDRAILQRARLGNGETDDCSSAGED